MRARPRLYRLAELRGEEETSMEAQEREMAL
jgi:hypothetical protein